MNTDNNQNITNGGKTFFGLPMHFYHSFFAFVIGFILLLFCVWVNRNHGDWILDPECYADYIEMNDIQHAGDACLRWFAFIYALIIIIGGLSAISGLLSFCQSTIDFFKERFRPAELTA